MRASSVEEELSSNTDELTSFVEVHGVRGVDSEIAPVVEERHRALGVGVVDRPVAHFATGDGSSRTWRTLRRSAFGVIGFSRNAMSASTMPW